MGKNYSLNNASGKRNKDDLYSTPYSLTREFLRADFWYPKVDILEPCEGQGAIVKVLKEFNFSFIESHDINTDGQDFLDYSGKCSQLLTNPPYKLAQEFILKAKEIVTLKFAFLLPLSYLQGSKRYNEIWLDRTFPLSKVYVFNRYPMFGEELREDGKFNTGMQTYAWFVWEKGKHFKEPVIRWIDVDAYVLRKEDTL